MSGTKTVRSNERWHSGGQDLIRSFDDQVLFCSLRRFQPVFYIWIHPSLDIINIAHMQKIHKTSSPAPSATFASGTRYRRSFGQFLTCLWSIPSFPCPWAGFRLVNVFRMAVLLCCWMPGYKGMTQNGPVCDTYTNVSATVPTGLGSGIVNGVYASGSTVYAATAGGLSISTDGGLSFSNKTANANGLGSNSVRGVYASGSTVYAATSGGLSFCTQPCTNPTSGGTIAAA